MNHLVELNLSTQAKNLLERMPDINKEEVIEWFCKVRKINVGGGDIIDYLNYLKSKEMINRG